MRIFNVDTISPIPTPQSTIAKNQHVQTDDPSKHNKYIQTTTTNTPTRNAHIQTSSTKQRTVMTQLSKRKVITRDVAMQFDRMLYYKDIERIINHVIMRIFSSKRFAAVLNGKAQKSNNQAPPLYANRLNRMGTRNRYCTLVNNRNNQDSLNKLSSYNRGFNVISRQQLLRTLDRIIDQKQQIILNERTCASKSLPLSRIRTNFRHSENALESKRKDQCKNG
ncbi:unnamed protein product [Anisakis simplex]|uniref:Uncharacterized protein n=1 Tax=Anisakis simplex TaxID=6269 RepID=A0A0M3J7T4_ANISI|nr:unnamed protein product [Anisakis simplex]